MMSSDRMASELCQMIRLLVMNWRRSWRGMFIARLRELFHRACAEANKSQEKPQSEWPLSRSRTAPRTS